MMMMVVIFMMNTQYYLFFSCQMTLTVLRLAMIPSGLPQEVITTQHGCGALKTLQKIKFYKDTHVCTYVFLRSSLSASFVFLRP